MDWRAIALMVRVLDAITRKSPGELFTPLGGSIMVSFMVSQAILFIYFFQFCMGKANSAS